MYEVYKFYKSRKTCLVFEPGITGVEMTRLANRHYKTRPERIHLQLAFIYKGELYFEDPDKRRSKTRWIAYLK